MLYSDDTIQCVLLAARDDQDWQDVAAKNGVKMRTAYRWVATARTNDAWHGLPRKPCGDKRNAKITDVHVDCIVGLLDENCYLTLDEKVDALEARFGAKVSRQTVKHRIDGCMYTIKQTHQDNNYRNLLQNKILRRDYVVDLLANKGEGKRAVDKNTASKGSNIHVVACISEEGLTYSEKRFGSFTSDKCNDFIRRLLRHISKTTPLNNAVLVCGNAPCHANVEDVFEEDEFQTAKLLRLGPYSPMLNPIENCFSTFKSMVKCFLARHHPAILQVPPHLTIKQHRESYLKMAADLLVHEAITPYICFKCSLYTVKFHARAIQMKDMSVGELTRGSFPHFGTADFQLRQGSF